jgi:hypothetical protein
MWGRLVDTQVCADTVPPMTEPRTHRLRFAANTEHRDVCSGFTVHDLVTQDGGVCVHAFNPDEDRRAHLSLGIHDATIERIDSFQASSNLPADRSVTLSVVDDKGVSVEVTLWGCTLDTLASAVEAAQREDAALS